MTVTYGASSAPFLFTRVLSQKAADYKYAYPEASEMIGRDFYVNDLMADSSDVNELVKRQSEIISIFKSEGMTLRKWFWDTSKDAYAVVVFVDVQIKIKVFLTLISAKTKVAPV